MNNWICIFLFLGIMISPAMYGVNGRVEQKRIKSDILGVEKEYSVYLPPGYDESDKKYPVLYLLHGAWGNHTDWVQAGKAHIIANNTIQEGLAVPMIIVMPDASGQNERFAGKNMGYFNLPGWSYEDFFIREFIPAVESAYRIHSSKKTRAIAGLSMGGGGTILFARKYPDYFSSACPLSALITGFNQEESEDLTKEFIQAADENDAVEYLKNADRNTLDQLRSVRWYVDCGDDDFLFIGNIRFYEVMKEKNVPLEYRMRNGAHDWEYWQSALPTVLQFVSVGFSKE